MSRARHCPIQLYGFAWVLFSSRSSVNVPVIGLWGPMGPLPLRIKKYMLQILGPLNNTLLKP